MKRLGIGVVVAALCLVVGCESVEPGDAPGGGEVSTRENTGGGAPQPTEVPAEEPTGRPPGVPGGPVRYDSSLVGLEALDAQTSVREQLKKLCPADSCGVEVVVAGTGQCTRTIEPNPVPRGGTITVTARPCFEPEDPSGETAPGETAGGTTTDEPVPTT